MGFRDLVALVNAVSVPIEMAMIGVLVGLSDRPVTPEAAGALGIVLGAQVAATAAYLAVRNDG